MDASGSETISGSPATADASIAGSASPMGAGVPDASASIPPGGGVSVAWACAQQVMPSMSADDSMDFSGHRNPDGDTIRGGRGKRAIDGIVVIQ
ncbi:MAG: hypothetical protein WAZ48_06985 [Lysobacteraceae bacterium]